MININRIIEVAKAEAAKNIRENDGNNRDVNKEIQKYWAGSHYPAGWETRAAYCAVTQTWIYNQEGTGVKVPRSASCDWLMKWAKNGGDKHQMAKFILPTEGPQVGDMILFDTSNPGAFNHIGTIIGRNGSSLTCIDGNTVRDSKDPATNDPDSALAGVWEKNRTIGASKISGYIRFLDGADGRTLVAELPPASADDTFLALWRQTNAPGRVAGAQQMCNQFVGASLKIDDQWGPKTEAAMRLLYTRSRRP